MKRFRKEKAGEVILACLGSHVLRSGDPRFSNVTLTGIEMSPDLKVATVYWIVPLGPEVLSELSDLPLKEIIAKRPDIAGPWQAFEDERKNLRRVVGSEVKMRFTPELRFKFDESELRAMHIDNLLKC